MTTPIETLLNQVEFKEIEGMKEMEGLYATHEGILKLGDIEIIVHQLNNGQRIIPTNELEKIFGDGFFAK